MYSAYGAVQGIGQSMSNVKDAALKGTPDGSSAKNAKTQSFDPAESVENEDFKVKQKNVSMAANDNVKAYTNKDGVRIFEQNQMVKEGKHYGSVKEMNEAWNTEVMTDADGIKYQGVAKISRVPGGIGEASIEIKLCIDCNSADVRRPNGVANNPQLGKVTGYNTHQIYLPAKARYYLPEVPGHELGHTLGLPNTNMDSIMNAGSRNMKATVLDIKALWEGYSQ